MSSISSIPDPALLALRDDVEKIRKLITELGTDVARDALRAAITACEKHQELRAQHLAQQERQEWLARQQRAMDEANANPTGRSATLRRWDINVLRPDSPFEAVVLATHCVALEHALVALEEVKSATPGFAPPIRELPLARFVPDAWRAGSGAVPPTCTLMYKQQATKKRFSLTFALAGGSEALTAIRISLAEKGGETRTAIVDTALQVRQGASAAASAEALFVDLPSLRGALHSLLAGAGLRLAMPQLAAGESEASMELVMGNAVGSLSEPSRHRPPGDRAGPDALLPVFASEGGRRADDFRVGGGDLNPFAPADPRSSQPFGPGSGSLVGPDHPLFGIPSPARDPGYPALPQPRFDPFGPVAGPNGPDFGNVGYDPRFPAGGGAGGRGRAPGEPDPDHLKPPDLPELGDGPGQPFLFPGQGGPGRGRGRGRGDSSNPFFR